MSDLNFFMEGKYLFRYLEEGENPDEREEDLQSIDMSKSFFSVVSPIALTLFPGFEFVQNPFYRPELNLL